MECLFRTTTRYTYDEYKRYNIAINKKRFSLFTLLADIIVLIGTILTNNWLFLIFAIVFPLTLYISIMLSVKKVFSSTKSMQNLDVTYEFFDEYFLQMSANGEHKYDYAGLYRIIETKTNFYLMIGSMQGCMISKKDMPDGLDEFIRSKRVTK